MEVPPGPLCARPPAGRPQRPPPLHMALVPGAHVAEGHGRGAVAANPARPGGAPRQPPTARWHLRPLHRLTLFKGETTAGRPHTVGVDWWGRVWDNDPAHQPPPPPRPGPAGTWLEVAHAVHALLPRVTDVLWATLPQPGGIHATAPWPDVLRRVDPALHQDLLHEVGQEARRLAGGCEQGHPPRTPAPPRAACQRRAAASAYAAPSTTRRTRLGLVTVADRLHNASGQGPGHAPGGGPRPPPRVALLAGGGLDLRPGGIVPVAKG